MFFKRSRYSWRDLKRLTSYIYSNLTRGVDDQDVEDALISVGWSKSIVTKEILEIRESLERGENMPRIGKKQAQIFLNDVPEDKKFFLENGQVLKNLRELSQALAAMEEKGFSHHVNKDKNDFARWVEHVVGDQTLARSLDKAKTKQAVIRQLENRISRLQKIIE